MIERTLSRPGGPTRAIADAAPERTGAHRPVLIATLLRQRGRTGVETHVRTAHAQLQSLRRPATVLTPLSVRGGLQYPVFAVRHALDPFSTTAGVWWYRAGHVAFLRRALRAHLAGAPDAVVYAQCPSAAAAALSLRTTQPVVLVAHFNGSEADEFAHCGLIGAEGRLARSIRAFEVETLARLDGIVYVSEHTRAVVEGRQPAVRGIPSATIHNSVPIIDRAPVAPIADLITVGTLDKRKNHAYLLEILAAAARRGHRPTLSVVGVGPERARLEQLARELGLGAQVRFHGFHRDPRSLMAGHTLYCHTATIESFGLVVVEAMAEGLPALAGRVGGIGEIVRPGTDGNFWPLEDPEAAADILIGVLSDPAGRARMSAAAARRARDSFSAQAQGAALLDFLDSVQARDPGF